MLFSIIRRQMNIANCDEKDKDSRDTSGFVGETAAFDPVTFASILMKEVDAIATTEYHNTSPASRRKSFRFWCVRNLSLELSDQEIESYIAACESNSPSEKPIEAAWQENGMVTFLQTSFIPLRIPNDPEDELVLDLFPDDPMLSLTDMFSKAVQVQQGAITNPSSKLKALADLYGQAVSNSWPVRLVAAIDGTPGTDLLRTRDEKNSQFRIDSTLVVKPFAKVVDFGELNEIVSEHLGGTPGPEPVQLEPERLFEVRDDRHELIALTATISARELARIREKYGYLIYHSNFRYLLKKQGVARPKIQHTLDDPSEHSNFWKYNNGITVTCSTLSFIDNWRYSVDGLQVVNGLQTIEALYENRNKDDNLVGVDLLIRIIPTAMAGEADQESVRRLERKIAEYSNSQTQITTRDLRSNDEIQRAIERVCKEVYGLKYVRKIGEEGETKWPSKYRVDNYEASQAALAFWHGLSNEASTKARLIFEEAKGPKRGYYEKVFKKETTAEYVLLPYLLWVSQNSLMKNLRPRFKGVYRNIDLFALSAIGDLLVEKWKIPRSPSTGKRQVKRLQCGIEDIRGLIDNKHERKLRRLWRPIFAVVGDEVERRRSAEAKVKDVPLSQVTPRNIAVKVHYPRDLRSVVMADKRIKSLRTQLGNFFTC